MSVLAVGSRRPTRWIIAVLVFGVVLGVLLAGSAIAERGANVATNLLTDNLAEPLNGATSAKLDIYVGDGNLTIDRLTGGEPLLAGGTLQYAAKQGAPTRTVTTLGGQTSLTLQSGRAPQGWLRLPWASCNGASEWRIHLNPAVASDISARSGGGNVNLDLSGIVLTGLTADTGGGNMTVVLPDTKGSLRVVAKSGAGNVSLSLPGGIAARIEAKTGVGKVTVDPRFSPIDKHTYESPNFASAADKVEISLSSGAGNVIVETR